MSSTSFPRRLGLLAVVSALGVGACSQPQAPKTGALTDPSAVADVRDGWSARAETSSDSEVPPADREPPEVLVEISEPFYGGVGVDRVTLASQILGLGRPEILRQDEAEHLLSRARDVLAGGTIAGPAIQEDLKATIAALEVDGPAVDPTVDVAAVLAATRAELAVLAERHGVALPASPLDLPAAAEQIATLAGVPTGPALHVRLAMAQQRRVLDEAGQRAAAALGSVPGNVDIDHLADGHVTRASVTVKGPAGPLRLWMLGLHPGDGATDLAVSAPGRLLPVSAHAAGVPQGVAAVNGGFWTQGGDPDGLTVIDGLLVSDTSSGKTWVRDRRPAFGIDEERAHAGLPSWNLAIATGPDAPGVPVRGWDRPVNGPADLIGSIGAAVPSPPDTPAIAFDVHPAALTEGLRGQVPMADVNQPVASGLVRVYVTGNATRQHLGASSVHLDIEVDEGFAGLDSVIAGGPTLLRAGHGVDTGVWRLEGFGPRHTDDRHPRTFAGVDRWGNVLLVVVDGRQPGWSVGTNQGETAAIAAALDLVDAVQLDGGGSSTFLAGSRIHNRPSDGRQRPVATALVVRHTAT